jgi:beta-lactamase class D
MMRIIGAFFLMISSCVSATEWKHSADIEEIFSDAEVRGTFVLYDAAENIFVGFDRKRAETRFIPASTFKVPHTLIGLAEGAVENVDEVLPYGGKKQLFSSWEKDMSLREAMPVSNVPVYQELARRITLDRMAKNLTLIGYGNNEVGTAVDKFWLEGPLTISAVEQTIFLAALAQNKLPYTKKIQDQVREVIRLENDDNWELYGKTGWTDSPDPDIGWWVGWVVKEGKIYSFALNIDMLEASDSKKRVELGRKSLISLGIL